MACVDKTHHETSMRPRLKRRGLFGSVSSFPTGNSALKGRVSTVVNHITENLVLVLMAVTGLYISGNSKENMRKGGLSYFAYMVIGIAVAAILVYFAYAALKNPFG